MRLVNISRNHISKSDTYRVDMNKWAYSDQSQTQYKVVIGSKYCREEKIKYETLTLRESFKRDAVHT